MKDKQAFWGELKGLYREQEAFFSCIEGQQTKIIVDSSNWHLFEESLIWNVEGANGARDMIFTRQLLVNTFKHGNSMVVIGGSQTLYNELTKVAKKYGIPCTRKQMSEVTNLDMEQIDLYPQIFLVYQEDYSKSVNLSSGTILEMLFERRKEVIAPCKQRKIACCVCGLDKMYPDERILQIMLSLRGFNMRVSVTYDSKDGLHRWQEKDNYLLWNDVPFNTIQYTPCETGQERVSIFFQSDPKHPVLTLQ